MTTRPVLYVLIGIAGSGKSSWGKQGNCVAVNPDAIWEEEIWLGGTVLKLTKKVVWKAFRQRLRELSEHGVDIVADATHLKRQWRYITANQVSEEYKKVAVVFHTDFELCCKRRADRFERWQMEEMRDSMEAIESREKFDALIHVYFREERELSLIKL